jgi:hypothetical protein
MLSIYSSIVFVILLAKDEKFLAFFCLIFASISIYGLYALAKLAVIVPETRTTPDEGADVELNPS